MLANARFSGFTSLGAIAITALLALLFPPVLGLGYGGEKDDKDAIIKMLKEQIERQQKDAERTQKEFEATRAREEALLRVVKQLASNVKERQLLEAQLKFDLDTLKAKADLAQKLFDLKNKEFELQAKDAQTILEQALVSQKRLAEEIRLLNKAITDREALIVKIQADVNVLRVQAQNFEAMARARQIQNEGLLETIRELTRHIARLESGVDPKPNVDPNAPNPPKVAVNGKIEKISDNDPSLVQITLGTDHGVNKNHTLDVYRATPEPKYLGMVRIIEAYPQKSVGRLVKVGATTPMVRVDDLVTSKTSGGAEPKNAKDDAPKDPGTPNPPLKKLDGKIEKIDAKDASLVQISLGAEHGLEKDHTLDVYRTQPEPKYLGMIRIVEVSKQSSFGRLITIGNSTNRAVLKEGDHVTSKITR